MNLVFIQFKTANYLYYTYFLLEDVLRIEGPGAVKNEFASIFFWLKKVGEDDAVSKGKKQTAKVAEKNRRDRKVYIHFALTLRHCVCYALLAVKKTFDTASSF